MPLSFVPLQFHLHSTITFGCNMDVILSYYFVIDTTIDELSEV